MEYPQEMKLNENYAISPSVSQILEVNKVHHGSRIVLGSSLADRRKQFLCK